MATQARRERIDWIVKMIESASEKAEGFIDSVKFVSMCSYNLGVSTEKIVEYLSMLAGMGVVRIDWGEKRIYFERLEE